MRAAPADNPSRRSDPPGTRPRARAFCAAALLALSLALPGATLARSAPAGAGPAEASRADCDAPAFDRLLVAPRPNAGLPGEARAYWLSRAVLAWPGGGGPGRFRLHVSRDGQLELRDGRVRGADTTLTLSPATVELPPPVLANYRFVGDGPRLSLPTAAVGDVRALLQGQILLTREDASGNVLASTRLQTPGALDDLYGDAAADTPLGPRFSAEGELQLSVWAPTARAVAVCLYPGDQATATSVLPLKRDIASGAWHMQAAQAPGSYYLFLVDVFVPGIGVVRNRVTDPYSVALGANSHRSQALDLNDPALAPAGWSNDRMPATVSATPDMSIYELHVRDFSISDDSVPAPHRGKYLAFTDTDSRGMRHLRALAQAGLTDLHLLPVFDFATVPEVGCTTVTATGAPDGEAQQAAAMAGAASDCFNWGYDPVHYNVPEGSYASTAHDGAVRIREFRAMVQALHAAGLRVGMDMVYNHMTASGQREFAVLDRIVPGYYQRLDDKGVVARSTCCDNTATEHRMMARLMEDSVALWASAYHVDSFRFDLMGHQPRAAMEALRDRLRGDSGHEPSLIGEGWNFGEVANGARFVQASQLSLNGSRIGTFSDRGRDALRGGGAGDSGAALVANQGWLNGLVYAPNASAATRDPVALLRAADMVRVGLAGSLRDFPINTFDGAHTTLSQISYGGSQPAGYASQPSEVVNYVENHDNQTLFDINVYRLPRDTSRNDRARVQVLGMAVVAFSQGIAYFHAGVDLLRSKSLDRNSYDSGDAFNRLDWSGQDNGFAEGLPPKNDNGRDWDLMRPLLVDASIKPTPDDITFARDAFRDLLRIRASTPLFHLRSAHEVAQRLSFPNTGPGQNPLVIAGVLDGAGLPDAVFDTLVYLLNVSPTAQSLVVPALAGHTLVLHPVLAAASAADHARLAGAHFDPASGRFDLPPRTALVYVLPRP